MIYPLPETMLIESSVVTVDRACLRNPSFFPRDEARKRDRRRVYNRHTFNGDIDYPCLFSLCFQLPLPGGSVVTYPTPGTRVWTTVPSFASRAKDEKRDEIEKAVQESRNEMKRDRE